MQSGQFVESMESWSAIARALSVTPRRGQHTAAGCRLLVDWMRHGASRGFDWRSTYEDIREGAVGLPLPDPDSLQREFAGSRRVSRLLMQLTELRDDCARRSTTMGRTMAGNMARGETIQLTGAISGMAGLRDADHARVRTILEGLHMNGVRSRAVLADIASDWSRGR